MGYAADTTRQKFTGYQKDTESGLDFAQARMYGGSYGRFTSPDPFNIIFVKEMGRNEKERRKRLNNFLLQPQNHNRYAYVLNNPTNLIDPFGLIWLNQKDSDSYIWVDDAEYKKERDGKYKGFQVANGKVISYDSGNCKDCDPSLKGKNVF